MSEGREPEDGPDAVPEIPFFAGTIIGLRAWEVEEEPAPEGYEPPAPRLAARFTAVPWEPDGEWTVARCVGLEGTNPGGDELHPAPQPDCGCGLYAYHPDGETARELFEEVLGEQARRELDSPGVAGVIEAAGRIEVHRDGFRAGRARVLALFVPAGAPERARRLVRRLARIHCAEAIEAGDPSDLLAYCEWTGGALSAAQIEELVPSAPELDYPSFAGPGTGPGTIGWPAPAPSAPSSPSGPLGVAKRALELIGAGIGYALFGVVTLLYCGVIAMFPLAIVGGLLGWFDEEPKPPPPARVAKVKVDREKCSVSALVVARRPVKKLTLRATGRDWAGRGFGHLEDDYRSVKRGRNWIAVGELDRKLCSSPRHFIVQTRAVWPGRLGAKAKVKSRSRPVRNTREPATSLKP